MLFNRFLIIALLFAPMLATAAIQSEPLKLASHVEMSAKQDALKKISINKASIKELKAIKGVSLGSARAVLAYRKKHGDFKSFDEVKNMKGFKRMKAEKWQTIVDQLDMD